MPQPLRRRRVFVSYRRADSAGHAGRLRDDLTELLGSRVFMDVADIAPGARFPEVLAAELRSCGVVLAVIGPLWRDAFDAPREGDDFVRMELVQALTHQGINVVPVLVQGASLPSAGRLPEDLKPLSSCQALSIRDDRWKDDVENLARHLRVLLRLRRWPVWLGAIGCVLLAVIGYWIFGRPPAPAPYDRGRAHEIAIAATEKAAMSCKAPKGAQGECPVLLRFQPDGKVKDVYYDTGWCAFKGPGFGDCVLEKLAKVRIPPFSDFSFVEVGLDVRIEANGDVKVTKY